MSEGTWAEIELVTNAEGLRVKAHGNVDIIEYGAEGQNVKALDSLQICETWWLDIYMWIQMRIYNGIWKS